jgi:hypothetical protein
MSRTTVRRWPQTGVEVNTPAEAMVEDKRNDALSPSSTPATAFGLAALTRRASALSVHGVVEAMPYPGINLFAKGSEAIVQPSNAFTQPAVAGAERTNTDDELCSEGIVVEWLPELAAITAGSLRNECD